MFSLGHCRTPGNSSGSSCQLLTRKKRRGIIEKRRRDRINTSLTELRRLVPSALEKQGSAKLEKAEILQMTVDHLKMLHAKGVDAFTFDPHKFAMDYHNMGFRECASEVARYLVAIEGIDLQDPLRLRLMSHLQCYSTQREIAAKSANSSWTAASPGVPTPQYPPPLPVPSPQHPATSASSSPADSYTSSGLESSPGSFRQPFPSSRSSHQHSMSLSPPSGLTLGAAHVGSNQYFPNHGFVPPTSSTSMPGAYGTELSQQTGVKPYRPWGTELAY
ncbi:hairy/enhancer-of-split related with YRPW motif protein-like [Ornithodoros turicata]|uniref:hairy/enhancer-of-split related with YRPW motif protein-like n=1 Tax=Ornithodoros turicata TaxID=34597 RepID=UPI003138D01F